MSGAALVWAMRHKKWCESTGELVVLQAIADHMNRDLKNSHASQATLAEETFMSARSVGTHMRSLAKRGVIVPGDPEAVAHIRPDRRPPVWDFPVDLPKEPPSTGNEFHPSDGVPAEADQKERVARDATRKRPTGGKSAQPRVETVADEPGSTEPGESVSGDGRRPSTGSRGRTKRGDAASNKQGPGEKIAVADFRRVVEGIPAPLAAQLNEEFARGLPASVNEAIAKAVVDEQRTVEQLVARLERRWLHWSYEREALSESGQGLGSPLGVLLTLLGPSACWGNNSRCEDGIDVDTDVECPRCVEAREEKAAERTPDTSSPNGYSVPFQAPTSPAPSPYVRCSGRGCGVKMLPTEDGLCRECRQFQMSEAAKA